MMNTNFYIALPKGTSKEWKKPVEKWLHYVASEWSRFREDNELARLNQLKIGDTIAISSLLYDCLKKANNYFIQTHGLFSPYLKKQLEQHGYNQSFPFQHAENLEKNDTGTKQSPIQFLSNHTVLRTDEQQIDLGGFAKGYIVEKIAEWLQQETCSEYGMVDGGGDMNIWSSCDKEWTIGVADPYKEEEEISYIKIKNGAIATSNRVYRSWKQGNDTKHHLLNGQTGIVANTDVLQATVVTKSLCDAEVACKLCFLLHEKELQQWLGQHQIPSACFIVKENEKGYWIKGGGKIHAS